MKRLIYCYLLIFPWTAIAQKSFETRKDAEAAIKNGSYTSSSGWELKEGQEIQLGRGSMPDKTFAFITEMPNLLTYNEYADYSKHKLNHSYNGKKANLAGFLVVGTKRSGFTIAARLKVGQLSRYLLDIDNAIEAKEVQVPSAFAVKSAGESNSATGSLSDELAKLKKLYDDGVLSKEEYEAAKKKVISQ